MWDNNINVGKIIKIINYNIITNLDWVNKSKAKTRLKKKKNRPTKKTPIIYISMYIIMIPDPVYYDSNIYRMRLVRFFYITTSHKNSDSIVLNS